MRRTARVSSQPVDTGTGTSDGPALPEAPPAPDQSFWNDADPGAQRSDWMDALAESEGPEAAAELPGAAAELPGAAPEAADTTAAPPSPTRPPSAFAAVTSGWVEPVVDDDTDAATDPEIWARPVAPIARIGETTSDDAPAEADDGPIVFRPVPLADVVPIRAETEGDFAAENLSWLDADGLDDLLPPA